MGPVFISYSSRDRDRVAELAGALTAQGFQVWWDTELPPGEDWDERIQRALESARTVLVVWSENAMASREVRAEATYGLQEKKLLPIRIEDVRLWARYNIVQYEDVFSRPPERDSNWPVVVRYLKKYVATEEADGSDEDTAPITPAIKPQQVRGGAVVPASMILPAAMTGAGGLTFLIWLLSGGGSSLGATIQFYSAVGLLVVGAIAAAISLRGAPRTR